MDNSRIRAEHEGRGRVAVGFGTGIVPVLAMKVGMPRRSLTPRAEEVGAGTVRVVTELAGMLAGTLVGLRRGEVMMAGHRLRSTRKRAQKTF